MWFFIKSDSVSLKLPTLNVKYFTSYFIFLGNINGSSIPMIKMKILDLI